MSKHGGESHEINRLFSGDPSLALQTKWEGVVGLPTPLLVWEGPAGGRSSKECRAAAAPLLTAGRAGGRSRESHPPTADQRDLNAEQEAQRQPTDCAREAYLRNGINTSCSIYLPGCHEHWSEDLGRPRGEGGGGWLAGSRPTPPPTRWARWDQPRVRGLVPPF